ncbi:MAG TPA: hypothetical protein PKB12_09215, partial [Elusimicrobiota bacterium]|nr:hypothetical protein [Elusimicrobiota bacterium]
AGFTRLVPGERLAEVLWRELRSLGIDPRAVSVRGIGRDIELEFSWSHPNGDGLRRRIVVFREGDLVDRPSIVEEPWDVYYQRAPMKMPEAYARPDNYVARLETLRRPNGVYVTDDVTDFLLNRPGPGARADRAAQFPLRTREWPMPEALENAVLEFKYPGEPLQRLRGRLTEGYGYGWRVRIRQPLTGSGMEGRSPAVDAELTEIQRRSLRDALERLAPAPFEGLPALQTLTLADWSGASSSAAAAPTPGETRELAGELARWEDPAVRAAVEKVHESVSATTGDAARSAAVLDELNHPWGENRATAAGQWVDRWKAAGGARDAARDFVDRYNVVRRALWALRLEAAELNRRSVKAIDVSPLFNDARASERTATLRALELARRVPAGGVTHLLVDWDGLRSAPEEADGAIVRKAEARLNQEVPGLLRLDNRVALRLWVRGTSAGQKVFQPEGI